MGEEGFLPWPRYRRSPDRATTRETTLHSEGQKGGKPRQQGDRTSVRVGFEEECDAGI